MKIAFYINDITRPGGTERITATLCNMFCRKGHDVTVISNFRENEKLYFSLLNKINVIYLNSNKRAKGYFFFRVFDYLGCILKLNKVASKSSFDCVIGQGFPMNLILYFSSFNKHICLACEHIYYYYYSVIIRIVRNVLYKKFRRVIVLSSEDKKLFRRYLLNVVQIPNMAFFSCIVDKSSLKDKVIISVGRLEKQKGFDLLIKAMKKVIKVHPDWILNIYGDGSLQKELERLIRECKLENNVFLKGVTSDIACEYKKSSFYVLSSRFEGFGLVLIEAAAFGLPIISFDCPNGPSDILSNGKGILVPNEDVDELSNQIIYLIEHPNRMRELAIKDEEIVKSYSEENIYMLWEQLFKTIA